MFTRCNDSTHKHPMILPWEHCLTLAWLVSCQMFLTKIIQSTSFWLWDFIFHIYIFLIYTYISFKYIYISYSLTYCIAGLLAPDVFLCISFSLLLKLFLPDFSPYLFPLPATHHLSFLLCSYLLFSSLLCQSNVLDRQNFRHLFRFRKNVT